MKLLVPLLVFACALVPARVSATAQVPDVLVLDGKEVPLNTNPLEPYLRANAGTVPRFPPGSTANWRGYVATFVIRGNVLIVDKVEVSRLDESAVGKPAVRRVEDVITQVFGGSDDVPATWYTGALVIPCGKLVNYVHMGYGSTYERYTVLQVRNGYVLERLDMTADEFTAYRKERFAAFKKTPEYRARVAEMTSRRGSSDASFVEDFLYDFESEFYLSRD